MLVEFQDVPPSLLLCVPSLRSECVYKSTNIYDTLYMSIYKCMHMRMYLTHRVFTYGPYCKLKRSNDHHC